MTRLIALALACAFADDTRLDRSRAYTYTLPEGWQVKPSPLFKHDVIQLPGETRRNIVINDQQGESSPEELKAKYEKALARALKGFRLLGSKVVELGGRKAVRIVHTNTNPGVAVRQVNYIVEFGGKRYFVACTTLEGDKDEYDERFEAFVKSLAKP